MTDAWDKDAAFSLGRKWISKFPFTPDNPMCIPEEFPEHWFRVHVLPGWRYAEDEDEAKIAVNRHLQVITYLDGVNGLQGTCLFVTNFERSIGIKPFDPDELVFVYDPGQEKPDLDYHLFLTGEEERIIDSNSRYLDQDTVSRTLYENWDCFVGEITVGSNEMRSVIEPLAYPCLLNRRTFFAPDLSWIYAPYDGGGDIYMDDLDTLAELRKHFEFLKPPTENGM